MHSVCNCFYFMTSLEVATLQAALPSCVVLSPCLTMNSHPDWSSVTYPYGLITMLCSLLLASMGVCVSAFVFAGGQSRQCLPCLSGTEFIKGLFLCWRDYKPLKTVKSQNERFMTGFSTVSALFIVPQV